MPSLLTFASQQRDDYCDRGPDVVKEEVMEGEEKQDKGIGVWGGHLPHTPPRRVLGKYSLPLGSLLVDYTAYGRGATRHTNGIPVLG